MSAAETAREHLTTVVWDVLRSYSDMPRVHHADAIITAAESYGHAILADEAAPEGAAAGRLAEVTSEYYRRPA